MTSTKTVLVTVFVLLAVSSIFFLSSTGSDEGVGSETPGPTSSKMTRQQKTTSTSSSTTSFVQNDHDAYRNIIFSCFYFRKDFYSGRTVPPLDWIIVMIESAFANRYCRTCISNNNSSFVDTRLVMFVDGDTKFHLERIITQRAEDPKKMRPDFFRNGFLELDLISPDEDPEVAALFKDHAWADSTKLKNAANNFRFWFIRRYLTNLMHNKNKKKNHQHQDEERIMRRLSYIRIAICDATDVLFQRNPFEEGICFPSSSESGSQPQQRRRHRRLDDDDGQNRQRAQPMFLFTLEDAKKNFHNERYNKRWMKCYADGNVDRSALVEMDRGRMRISCAGVSFGTFFGVLTYVNAQLLEISKPALEKCATDDIKAALDQATHNYLMFRAVWRGTHKEDDQDPSSGSSSSWVSVLQNPSQNGGTNQVTVIAIPEHHNKHRTSWHWPHSADFTSLFNERNARVTRRIMSVDSFMWNSKDVDCVFHGNFGKPKMSVDWEVLSPIANINPKDGSENDVVYAVVHQYTSDRHPPVMKAARAKYKIS